MLFVHILETIQGRVQDSEGFVLFFYEAESHCVVQVDLEFVLFLPLP